MNEVEWSDVQNQQLLDNITTASSGTDLTKVAAAGSQMLKRKIREFGFQRVILPYVTVTNDDLDKLPGSEEAVIIEEMEPNSPGAVTLPFNGTADTAFFYRDDFVVTFFKISTPSFCKNINELRTTRGDLRQVITDNALKDMHTEEDGRLIATVDEICGDDTGVGASGVNQYAKYNAVINRRTYPRTRKALNERHIPVGIYLANDVTRTEECLLAA
jgi:hypothetical protein